MQSGTLARMPMPLIPRDRGLPTSVHLLEHLLADHTLRSHLLKQTQMLVIGQTKATRGVSTSRGSNLENTQWLLFFPSWFELTNSLESGLNWISVREATACEQSWLGN